MAKGYTGLWAFWLHRISGVGIAFFLLLHASDTVLMLWGPTLYNQVMHTFAHPAIRLLELLLVAAVVYHAVNGLRIMGLDVWPALCRVQHVLFWLSVGLMLVLFMPIALLLLRTLLAT